MELIKDCKCCRARTYKSRVVVSKMLPQHCYLARCGFNSFSYSYSDVPYVIYDCLCVCMLFVLRAYDRDVIAGGFCFWERIAESKLESSSLVLLLKVLPQFSAYSPSAIRLVVFQPRTPTLCYIIFFCAFSVQRVPGRTGCCFRGNELQNVRFWHARSLELWYHECYLSLVYEPQLQLNYM